MQFSSVLLNFIYRWPHVFMLLDALTIKHAQHPGKPQFDNHFWFSGASVAMCTNNISQFGKPSSIMKSAAIMQHPTHAAAKAANSTAESACSDQWLLWSADIKRSTVIFDFYQVHLLVGDCW